VAPKACETEVVDELAVEEGVAEVEVECGVEDAAGDRIRGLSVAAGLYSFG